MIKHRSAGTRGTVDDLHEAADLNQGTESMFSPGDGKVDKLIPGFLCQVSNLTG